MNQTIKLALLSGLILAATACGKPSDSSPPPTPIKSSAGGDTSTGGDNGNGGAGSAAGGQIGTGSNACPFSQDPGTYAIKVPEATKLLDVIPEGKYVLTMVKTYRTSLTTPETDVFTSAAKIILKEPGRIGTSDTIQMVVQNSTTAVTAGNLSFPVSFAMSNGKITWGKFSDYEPKITTASQIVTAIPVVKEHDEKILKENTGRHAFNVFARKRISGYQAVVKLSQSDFGVIKGTIAIEADAIRFLIEIPRGSSSVELIESTYELVFTLESKAKAPDCGGNASAVRVLGS